MPATSWDDFLDLLREPWVLQSLGGLVLFVAVLWLTRTLRSVAAELERRRALSDYVRGLDEFLRGDHREAIGTLESVLDRDPENIEARIALGDCYRATGDAAEAKRHHHHVHKVFGNELARNFVSLGQDELALGQFDRAVEAFERARELQPDETSALWGLAQAYAEGGQPIEAAEFMRLLYPQGPTAEMSRFDCRAAARRFSDAGRAALLGGAAETAVRFYTEALAFQPSDLRARSGLLQAAQGLGDTNAAKDLVREHLDALKRLSSDDDVLFEPAREEVIPSQTNKFETAPTAAASTKSLVPVPIADVGTLAIAVANKTARYCCQACGTLLRDHGRACSFCGAVGTVSALPELEAAYTMPLRNSAEAAEEVEESTAFVQSLAQNASLGDDGALAKLLAIGPSALYDVFASLPVLEARRYLGARLSVLGPEAAREVRACHRARANEASAQFAVGFYLGLGTGGDSEAGDRDIAQFGPTMDDALAGALTDPRLDDEIRDRAQELLGVRGIGAIIAVVDAVAITEDASAVDRAAALCRPHGKDAVDLIVRRYFQAKLLGRIFGRRTGRRRRAAAEVLSRTGIPEAIDALRNAAAHEKDDGLRSHYAAMQARAESGASS